MSERRTQEWLALFNSGSFDVNDALRSGRPVTEKVDEILQLVEQDRLAICVKIAEALNINCMTVWNNVKRAGYTKTLYVWLPEEITQRNLIDRITSSETLLKYNEIETFLKRIIAGKIIQRKRSWSKGDEPPQTSSKRGLTTNKVMLSVCWYCKGIIYYELLQPGETINSVLYCSQLDRLKEAIKKKRTELPT